MRQGPAVPARVFAAMAGLAALLLAAGAVLQPVAAQAPEAGNFLNPFPESETYKIQVFGDSLAEGLLGGLAEGVQGETRLNLLRKHRRLTGILRGEAEDETAAIDTELGRDPVHIAVVMFNPADRYPWRQSLGRRQGSEAWREEFDRRRDDWKAQYGARLDRLMRAFKRRGIAAYFVGLPILRRQDATDDAQILNELVRERAYVNGMRYIDVLATFADEEGVYSAQGPDLTGRIRQLREADGIHFTPAGYRKLAHFVEREIKRDVTQARSERSIPLAGAEPEQRRIRPTRPADLASVRPGQPSAPAAKGAPSGTAVRPALPDAAAGDVKADNARVTIRTVNAQGREESLTLDVLRPSIPANVLQLVTRRESVERPSQVGDTIVTEANGGILLVSTVSPAADPSSDVRRSTPANAPFFRALVKGERLESRPGRSDDFPWPRPEDQPQPPEPVEAPKAAAPVAPQAAPRGPAARRNQQR